MDFRRNKFNFMEQLQLKILFKQDILSKQVQVSGGGEQYVGGGRQAASWGAIAPLALT